MFVAAGTPDFFVLLALISHNNKTIRSFNVVVNRCQHEQSDRSAATRPQSTLFSNLIISYSAFNFSLADPCSPQHQVQTNVSQPLPMEW